METATTSNQILPKPVLEGILKRGLVIVGGKEAGKSNAGKVVTAEIIRNQPLPIQVKAFDSASNLRWDFEEIFCQEITEKTRHFYAKDGHILFDVSLSDEDKLKFMKRVVMNDYLKQRDEKEKLGGYNTKWILYLVEEAQDIIGRYSLASKRGRKLLARFAEGRNFNQSFIFIGQRLADVSASAIERCDGYFFGKMNGDNDLAKLKRIVGKKSPIVDEVQKLDAGKGQFMYYNGQSTYELTCPKYDSGNKRPKMWTPNIAEIPMWKYVEGRKII